MQIDDFKAFVKTIPAIREEVVNGHYTWQQLYEFYVLLVYYQTVIEK